MSAFTRGRALIAGVGDYADKQWNAPTATRDAQSFHRVLISDGGYGPGQAELLIDADATRDGLLLALRRLADRCGPDSVAVISITSHGATGEDGLYTLATSDARFTPGPDSRIVKGTGLNVADLARALRDIPARQLLLILNACFAGTVGGDFVRQGISPDPALGELLPNVEGDRLLATGEGRAILSAGKPGQRSYFKPEEQHSYFGQALIDALKGSATTAASGAVGLYELYDGVYRQVHNATARRLGLPQDPVLTVIQSAGPFVVASARGDIADERSISQRPASDLPLRVVPQTVVQAIGAGSTAINAAGSTVTVDNSKLIDFGNATVMGGVNIGNVARGDIINVNSPTSVGGAGAAAPEPLRDLPIFKARVEVARNVDEEQRDIAALKLGYAHKAYADGDVAKARHRIDEALIILRAMNNGYITSVVRKLESLKQAL
jgi:hypothetical protein